MRKFNAHFQLSIDLTNEKQEITPESNNNTSMIPKLLMIQQMCIHSRCTTSLSRISMSLLCSNVFKMIWYALTLTLLTPFEQELSNTCIRCQ